MKRSHAIWLSLILVVVQVSHPCVGEWNCSTVASKDFANGSVRWSRMNCTATTRFGKVGPITVNTVTANLSDPNLFVLPVTAPVHNGSYLAPLTEMMSQQSRAIVGINGGYFWRLDVNTFFDDVCIGKWRTDALRPVSETEPNNGIGDGLTLLNGKRLSSNCDCYGYNRPTTLVIDGAKSHIVVQSRGAPPPASAVNAIAAGPNLVSTDPATKVPFVDIPKDDQNLNLLGRGANAAVGLSPAGAPGAPRMLHMAAFDGNNKCPLTDTTCGINVYPMATFMLEYLRCGEAMAMDQGGSTTMVVKGSGFPNEVVSCSSTPNCYGGQRNIFNGLVIGLKN